MTSFDYKFDEKIKYKNKEIKLDLDFKNVIKAYEIYEQRLPETFKAIKITNILLPNSKLNPRERLDVLPAIFTKITNIIKDAGGYNFKKKNKPVISFKKDIGAIYASFIQCYKIDIFKERLHILKFIMLLNNISKDTSIYEIISIRGAEIPISNKYNEGYIENLNHLKSVYSLYKEDDYYEENINSSLKEIFEVAKG